MAKKTEQVVAKAVDQFYNTLDRITLEIASLLKLRYLDALLEATRELCAADYAELLGPEVVGHLEERWAAFRENEYTNEEARLAWEELVIKGLKDARFPLSCLVPDVIGYLFATLANALYDGPYSVLDATMGIGNLLFTLKSYHKEEVLAIGVENERRLIQCARIGAALQNASIQIYANDLLKPLGLETDFLIANLPDCETSDLVTSPLADEGVRYFPYLLIERRLDNLAPRGHFAFLASASFFGQRGSAAFRQMLLEKARLDAAIVLPEVLFKNKNEARIIIIGTKEATKGDWDTAILSLKGLDRPSLEKVVAEIRDLAATIKEETHS